MTVQANIVANYNKIYYTSYFDTDKIVHVYTGRVSVPTTALSYYAALPQGAVGQTQKMFTQMIWSLDGGTTWQDGDAQENTYSGGNLQYAFTATCYSSSTEIFLVVENDAFAVNAPARTVNYKIITFSVT